jgi:hypothetical protein
VTILACLIKGVPTDDKGPINKQTNEGSIKKLRSLHEVHKMDVKCRGYPSV